MIEMCAETQVGLHVNCPLFLSDFNEIGMCKILLVKLPNSKFHENPFNSSHVMLLHTDNMAKLPGAYLQLFTANVQGKLACKEGTAYMVT
jgi:hypothetical protein